MRLKKCKCGCKGLTHGVWVRGHNARKANWKKIKKKEITLPDPFTVKLGTSLLKDCMGVTVHMSRNNTITLAIELPKHVANHYGLMFEAMKERISTQKKNVISVYQGPKRIWSSWFYRLIYKDTININADRMRYFLKFEMMK